jgi:hypothetical protein
VSERFITTLVVLSISILDANKLKKTTQNGNISNLDAAYISFNPIVEVITSTLKQGFL